MMNWMKRNHSYGISRVAVIYKKVDTMFTRSLYQNIILTDIADMNISSDYYSKQFNSNIYQQILITTPSKTNSSNDLYIA